MVSEQTKKTTYMRCSAPTQSATQTNAPLIQTPNQLDSLRNCPIVARHWFGLTWEARQ